jgi:hypothetical protein
LQAAEAASTDSANSGWREVSVEAFLRLLWEPAPGFFAGFVGHVTLCLLSWQRAEVSFDMLILRGGYREYLDASAALLWCSGSPAIQSVNTSKPTPPKTMRI